MEGDEVEALLFRKLGACAPSAVQLGCQDEDLYFIDDEAIEGDGV